MKRLALRERLAFALAAAVLAFGGCGKSSDLTGAGPAAQQAAEDVAVALGAALASDPGGLLLELDGANAALPVAGPGEVPGPATADTTLTLGSLMLALAGRYYDLDDNRLDRWDASATRASMNLWLRGEIESQRYRATVARAGVLRVRGLGAADDTLRFDGAFTDTTDARFTSLDGERTVDLHLVATRGIAEVTRVKDAGAEPWPRSGQVSWTLSVDRYGPGPAASVEAHWESGATATFRGASVADLVVAGRWRFRVDLRTGDIFR
jgi:hypothetical protein